MMISHYYDYKAHKYQLSIVVDLSRLDRDFIPLSHPFARFQYSNIAGYLTMDRSGETAAELLAFNSVLKSEAGSIYQAFTNAELEGLDCGDFSANQHETEEESSWLYSEDPTLLDDQQQMDYDGVMNKDITAKSTLNDYSYANVSSNQAVTPISTFAQSMVSSDEPISSHQPTVQPPVSFVDPSSTVLQSLPSTNCGLDQDLFIPDVQIFVPFEEHQQPHDWEYQQRRQQLRLEQAKLEKVRLQQQRLVQSGLDFLISEELLREAENETAAQALKQETQRLNEPPIMPAATPQELRSGTNQPNQLQSDKASQRIRDAKNLRAANIASFVPEEHYLPLLQPPQDWGMMNPQTNLPTYQYTAEGELLPHLKYTEQQIREYLTNHPLHVNGRLTLWVQICPADSGGRYSDKRHSSKCRFKDCPIENNKIAIGEYRMAFDEQSWMGLPLDPYHNAGYVHLFCLEKNLDFPQLCKDFNVEADTRHFADERNKMAITRDHLEMEKVVEDFIHNSQPWNGAFDSGTYYPKTLCYALTMEHLKREPRKRQHVRDIRNGNSLDKHLNNLDVKAENITRKKAGLPFKAFERPVIEEPAVERPQPKKRKSSAEEDEVSSSGSPAKKLRVTEQPFCRTKVHSPALMRTQALKRKRSDDECVVSATSPAKRPKATKYFSQK